MINPHSLIVTGEQIDILKSKNADLEERLKVAEDILLDIRTQTSDLHGDAREANLSRLIKIRLLTDLALNKIRGE